MCDDLARRLLLALCKGNLDLKCCGPERRPCWCNPCISCIKLLNNTTSRCRNSKCKVTSTIAHWNDRHDQTSMPVGDTSVNDSHESSIRTWRKKRCQQRSCSPDLAADLIFPAALLSGRHGDPLSWNSGCSLRVSCKPHFLASA